MLLVPLGTTPEMGDELDEVRFCRHAPIRHLPHLIAASPGERTRVAIEDGEKLAGGGWQREGFCKCEIPHLVRFLIDCAVWGRCWEHGSAIGD